MSLLWVGLRRQLALIPVLLLTLAGIGHAQDYIDIGQITVVLKPGQSATVVATFSCDWENYILVSRHDTGERLVVFNSHHARRIEHPYEHISAGGGTWTSQTNTTDHDMVLTLTSGHKTSPPARW